MKRALGLGGPVRVALALGLLASTCFFFAACKGDESGDVTVTVTFPNAAAEMNTGTVHVWLVSEIPREDPEMMMSTEDMAIVTCARLTGGIVDPYDQNVERHGDQVYFMPLDGPAVLTEVDGGSLVYVEAIDQVGRIHLSGCAETDVPGSVTVELQSAGVFDCADAATEDGARCDDGSICTKGETCEDGDCQGGMALDCTFVADACHGSTCQEGVGCVQVGLPDGTPCEDGLFCTENDVCDNGICSGISTDCAARLGSGPCEIAFCDEALNLCRENQLPNTTPCDDGRYCTTASYCSFGSCVAQTLRTCPTADGICVLSYTCNDTMMACVPNNRTNGSTCSYGSCPGFGSCQSPGVGQPSVCVPPARDIDADGYIDTACGGNDCNDSVTNGALANPGLTELTSNAMTCGDAVDNDCDGMSNCADTGCAGYPSCP